MRCNDFGMFFIFFLISGMLLDDFAMIYFGNRSNLVLRLGCCPTEGCHHAGMSATGVLPSTCKPGLTDRGEGRITGNRKKFLKIKKFIKPQ